MIELQKLQEQVLKLPIRERWHLVKIILASIQQETLSSTPPQPTIENLSELDPWTQSLIGVINLETENTITSQPHSLKTFMEKYGTWEDERTAEEIVKEISKSRTMIESFLKQWQEKQQDEALAAACAVVDELELGWESEI